MPSAGDGLGLVQVGNQGSLQTRGADSSRTSCSTGIKAWEHAALGAATAETQISVGILLPWKGAHPPWRPCCLWR